MCVEMAFGQTILLNSVLFFSIIRLFKHGSTGILHLNTGLPGILFWNLVIQETILANQSIIFC